MTEVDTSMKNDSSYIIPYANGDKDMTARLHGDYDLEVGEEIALTDENGKEFGRATVAAVIRNITIRDFVQMELKGHKVYDNADEAVDEFSGYYPDEDITIHTKLDLIKFTDVVVYQEAIEKAKGIETIQNKCAECGSTNIVYQEGCEVCQDCGAMECTGDMTAANT